MQTSTLVITPPLLSASLLIPLIAFTLYAHPKHVVCLERQENSFAQVHTWAPLSSPPEKALYKCPDEWVNASYTFLTPIGHRLTSCLEYQCFKSRSRVIYNIRLTLGGATTQCHTSLRRPKPLQKLENGVLTPFRENLYLRKDQLKPKHVEFTF